MGLEKPVLLAASTHRDDDVAVLNALGAIHELVPDTLLILVPRHPERFSPAVSLSMDMGFRTERYSDRAACSPETQCFVIDAMGELLRYYACCDVAVIGGSFGTVGGHNALEASALSRPVMTGPNTENFEEITRCLIEAEAAIQVSDAEALGKEAAALLLDPERRASMGAAGKTTGRAGQRRLLHTLGEIDRLTD